MSDETYLGDGLYASFDGWQIMLRAPRETGDHIVALEPEVLASLVQYIGALEARHGHVAAFVTLMSATRKLQTHPEP